MHPSYFVGHRGTSADPCPGNPFSGIFASGLGAETALLIGMWLLDLYQQLGSDVPGMSVFSGWVVESQSHSCPFSFLINAISNYSVVTFVANLKYVDLKQCDKKY
jgi:hypothetical protein